VVALFGQLADAFDDSTWIAISAVGFGSPLFGALMRGCVQGSFRGDFWRGVAIYYGLLLAVVSAAILTGSVFVAIFFYVLLLAGPIFGLTLLATARRDKRGKQ
jgi:hypothetical protein